MNIQSINGINPNFGTKEVKNKKGKKAVEQQVEQQKDVASKTAADAYKSVALGSSKIKRTAAGVAGAALLASSLAGCSSSSKLAQPSIVVQDKGQVVEPGAEEVPIPKLSCFDTWIVDGKDTGILEESFYDRETFSCPKDEDPMLERVENWDPAVDGAGVACQNGKLPRIITDAVINPQNGHLLVVYDYDVPTSENEAKVAGADEKDSKKIKNATVDPETGHLLVKYTATKVENRGQVVEPGVEEVPIPKLSYFDTWIVDGKDTHISEESFYDREAFRCPKDEDPTWERVENWDTTVDGVGVACRNGNDGRTITDAKIDPETGSLLVTYEFEKVEDKGEIVKSGEDEVKETTTEGRKTLQGE